MALDAQVTFVNRLEDMLSDKLTVTNLLEVIDAVSIVLYDFSMTYTPQSGDESKDTLLDEYLAAMKVAGRSEKTLARYEYILRRMKDAVKVPTYQITVNHLRTYLADEKSRGVSDRTLEGMRQVFSAYFNWLQREGLIKHNPTANLDVIKYKKVVKTIYTNVDIEKLKEQCDNVRDKAIIHFLLATGCRISEVVGLDRDAINFEQCECIVLGKGDTERTVFFDDVTAMFLKEYLNSRTDDNPALFVAEKTHERLTAGGVRYMLHVVGDKANLKKVHPHKFRRTLATNLTAHGMPIQEVANILGHTKLDTTRQYVVSNRQTEKADYHKYR